MYSRILVPVDGSATSVSGMTEAIRLAQDQHATLRLIHIVNELIVMTSLDTGFGMSNVVESMRKHGEAVLKDSGSAVRAAGVEVDSILVEAMGDQAGTYIVKQAVEWRANLIVMGTHGRRGVRRMVMGSDAEFVVRHTPVPVLLIRQPNC